MAIALVGSCVSPGCASDGLCAAATESAKEPATMRIANCDEETILALPVECLAITISPARRSDQETPAHRASSPAIRGCPDPSEPICIVQRIAIGRPLRHRRYGVGARSSQDRRRRCADVQRAWTARRYRGRPVAAYPMP